MDVDGLGGVVRLVRQWELGDARIVVGGQGTHRVKPGGNGLPTMTTCEGQPSTAVYDAPSAAWPDHEVG